MDAARVCGRSDPLVDPIGQAREHRIESRRCGAGAVVRLDARDLDGERERLARRTAVEADDVEAAGVQQLRGEHSHFAETENRDPAQRHARLLRSRT